MNNIDEIYSPKLLEIAANIADANRLSKADATAEAHSKLCGSRVLVDLKMEDGKVSGFGQKITACLLGQASTAIMADQIIGSDAKELREISRVMRNMLKEQGPPPAGKWKDLSYLQPVRDYKARHASTLLVFDAVEDALDQIEKAQREASGTCETRRGE